MKNLMLFGAILAVMLTGNVLAVQDDGSELLNQAIVPLKQNTLSPNNAESSSITSSSTEQSKSQEKWTILLSDRVISNTLERWAEASGYQLVWQSKSDFQISSDAEITGDLRYAFNQVLMSFAKTNSPLKATWYKNHVIVVSQFSD